MSVSLKGRDFEHAALKKGFVQDRRRDHIVFFYVDENGRKSPFIKTKISHSTGEISASNLSKMKKQLKFEKMEQLVQYCECTFTLEQYRALLHKQGYQ
ncbi:MAG TPA: hypothetical protein O0X70_02260 [Methanocorpusculum sp.]|nr:hypothetical protein [Methanocorpusculum sp.]